MWKIDPLQILIAVGLDLIFGDPRGWPHITRMTGVLSTWYEKFLTNRYKQSVRLGLLFWILVSGTMLMLYFLVYFLCDRLHPIFSWLLEIFVVYQSLAMMDLSRHARAVLNALRAGDLEMARNKLSLIVGRDTKSLDEPEISRGTIECIAESTTDAGVAPLFWTLIAGAPGALIYRIANTLDSMVGHHDARYEWFGKASARIDDALNWLPARISAGCYAALSGFRHWRRICSEAVAHASPNAGWPEAAMAYAMGVQLGGNNSYANELVQGPIFNQEGRRPVTEDISHALKLMWKASFIAFVFIVIGSLIVNLVC